MHSVLRHIAIHVEEASPGHYAWVLSEQQPDDAATWTVIQRATAPASTYQAAMAQGLIALEAQVEDLDAGPRRTAEEPARSAAQSRRRSTTAAPAAAPSASEPPPASPGAKRGRPSLFGFGPAV